MLEFLKEMINAYPFGSLLVIMAVLGTTYYLLNSVLFCLPNRIVRHLSIRKAGWPPPHLNADGEFKACECHCEEEDDEEEDEESEEEED